MYSAADRNEFTRIYEQYIDMVFRICFSYMKNKEDAEDATQITFEKYLKTRKNFSGKEHEKAWFLKTAANTCKDMLRKSSRKEVPLEEDREGFWQDSGETEDLYGAILNLPEKYKLPIYLYYYEGYHTDEIAAILHRPASTVRNHLAEGRKLLRKYIGEEG